MTNPHAQLAFRVVLMLVAVGLSGALVVVLVGMRLSSSGSGDGRLRARIGTALDGGRDRLAANTVRCADTSPRIVEDKGLPCVESVEHGHLADSPTVALPSLAGGCHWEDCVDVTALPIQVSAMPGLPGGLVTRQADNGLLDAVYLAWFHSGSIANDTPDGAELVIWARGRGVRPGGSVVAESAEIAGARWAVWLARDGARVRITYEPVTVVTAINGLDIRSFTLDAAVRGHVDPEWYLVAVEAGVTPGRGGAGNAHPPS